MLEKKISDLDVIEFLIDRREKLATELKSIDTTIAGLKSSTDINFSPKLEVKSKHVQSQAKKENISQPLKGASEINIPSEYNISDSVDKRILFVIKTLGKGDRNEILDLMKTKFEPDADFEKLAANVKVRLSHLLKQGQIKGKRKGRLYQYSLS